MKKAKKAARSIKPVGRNPVIAVRVPEPLHERIKTAADVGGQSMSETMATLIQNGLDWKEAFGDRVSMLRQAREDVRRIATADLKARLLAEGWAIVHDGKTGAALFAPPEAGVARSGFLAVDEINAELDVIEDRIREIRASSRK